MHLPVAEANNAAKFAGISPFDKGINGGGISFTMSSFSELILSLSPS